MKHPEEMTSQLFEIIPLTHIFLYPTSIFFSCTKFFSFSFFSGDINKNTPMDEVTIPSLSEVIHKNHLYSFVGLTILSLLFVFSLLRYLDQLKELFQTEK
jgi:hypothetical protein